jgi:hypothetical protein
MQSKEENKEYYNEQACSDKSKLVVFCIHIDLYFMTYVQFLLVHSEMLIVLGIISTLTERKKMLKKENFVNLYFLSDDL